MTSQAMHAPPLVFCSSVPRDKLPLVEELFFFNDRQPVWHEGIRSAVEAAGCPAIFEKGGRISIGVPSGAMQCLFVCAPDGTPLGVMLYGRPAADTLWIAHLSVDPRYTAQGHRVSGGLGLQLVAKAREIALTLKGVSRIQLPYRESCYIRVRT